MNNSTYLKAMEIFKVEDELHDAVKLMLTEEEVELIVLMDNGKYSKEELAKIVEENNFSSNGNDFIDNSYNRAVLLKEDVNGNLFYKSSTLQKRFSYFTMYESEIYATVPDEMKKKLNDDHLEKYIALDKEVVLKKMRGEEAEVQNSDFLTLEEADEVIDRQDLIYMLRCDCRSMMYHTEKPIENTCMNFNSGPNTQYDRGHGEVITKERAKEIIRELNKKGLMQNGEDFAICNCDGKCCYPLQLAKSVDSKYIYPKSNYDIVWDEENCIHCGRCVKICNFDAFYFDENKKVHYDPEKCWECTICAPNCPKKVIHLIKK